MAKQEFIDVSKYDGVDIKLELLSGTFCAACGEALLTSPTLSGIRQRIDEYRKMSTRQNAGTIGTSVIYWSDTDYHVHAGVLDRLHLGNGTAVLKPKSDTQMGLSALLFDFPEVRYALRASRRLSAISKALDRMLAPCRINDRYSYLQITPELIETLRTRIAESRTGCISHIGEASRAVGIAADNVLVLRAVQMVNGSNAECGAGYDGAFKTP